MKIVVFGDDIAYGLWDPAGGWVQRLRREYDQASLEQLASGSPLRTLPSVYNLSIVGATAESIVRRLALELKARQDHTPLAVILAVGLNDTMIYKSVAANSTELFGGELQQILAAAQQFTDQILFVGLTAVDEAACNPWPQSGGDMCFDNARIREFETVMRDFCVQHTLPHVAVFEQFQKSLAEQQLLADGLHPNGAGHELVLQAVQPALDTLIA